MWHSLSRFFRSLLPKATGGDGALGSISEIEPGDGPPWGTLSGLTSHPTDPNRLYAVTDHDSSPIRILEIQVTPERSPRVVRQINVVAPGFGELDTEAIVAKPEGGFWLASEGAKNNSPPNLLLDVDATGVVTRAISLPTTIAERMRKKGIEGLALADTKAGRRLYVAFQAAIKGDPDDTARIAEVDPATSDWLFFAYPLSKGATGDVTGLSELVHIGRRRFAVIERDGEGGPLSFKRLMTFSLGSLIGSPPEGEPPLLTKQTALDLVPVFAASGREVEKEIEGLTVAADGQVYALNDNDNERPTLLLRLGQAREVFGD